MEVLVKDGKAYFSIDGKTTEIPEDQIPFAIGSGFTPATKAEALGVEKEKYFGSAGGQLKSGLLGALRGATLGLSDVVASNVLGVHPKDLKDYSDYNPISSSIGEVTGMVAPMLLSGGGGVLSKTPINQLFKFSEGLGKKGAESLTRVLANAESSALPKLTELALREGAIGAGLGIGSGISQVAQTEGIDFSKASEIILENALHGAILGEAFGIGMMGANKLASKVMDGAKKATAKFSLSKMRELKADARATLSELEALEASGASDFALYDAQRRLLEKQTQIGELQKDLFYRIKKRAVGFTVGSALGYFTGVGAISGGAIGAVFGPAVYGRVAKYLTPYGGNEKQVFDRMRNYMTGGENLVNKLKDIIPFSGMFGKFESVWSKSGKEFEQKIAAKITKSPVTVLEKARDDLGKMDLGLFSPEAVSMKRLASSFDGFDLKMNAVRDAVSQISSVKTSADLYNKIEAIDSAIRIMPKMKELNKFKALVRDKETKDLFELVIKLKKEGTSGMLASRDFTKKFIEEDMYRVGATGAIPSRVVAQPGAVAAKTGQEYFSEFGSYGAAPKYDFNPDVTKTAKIAEAAKDPIVPIVKPEILKSKEKIFDVGKNLVDKIFRGAEAQTIAHFTNDEIDMLKEDIVDMNDAGSGPLILAGIDSTLPRPIVDNVMSRSSYIFEYLQQKSNAYKDNLSDRIKFRNIFKTIANPEAFIDALISGKLTREHVQALKDVYPELFSILRSSIKAEYEHSLKDELKFEKQKLTTIKLFLSDDEETLKPNYEKMIMSQTLYTKEEGRERGEQSRARINLSKNVETSSQRLQRGLR